MSPEISFEKVYFINEIMFCSGVCDLKEKNKSNLPEYQCSGLASFQLPVCLIYQAKVVYTFCNSLDLQYFANMLAHHIFQADFNLYCYHFFTV